MEHPTITEIQKHGYLVENKQESYGTDYFGSEIFPGDKIVVTPDGENVLEESLEDYLIEVLGFKFKTVE
jgi:Hypothetical protein Yqai